MRIHITALLAVAALVPAACGGDDDAGAAGGAAPGDGNRQAIADFAECMREQGIDFPDPGSGEGPARISGDPEELGAAEEACAGYRDEIRPPELGEEQQEEFREAALAHARCMREQGIEGFPDPQFGEDGRVQLRLPQGIDPEDPDFAAAQETCQDELPRFRRGEEAP